MSTSILYIAFLTVVLDGEFGGQGARNMNSFKSSLKEQVEEDYLPLSLHLQKVIYLWENKHVSVPLWTISPLDVLCASIVVFSDCKPQGAGTMSSFVCTALSLLSALHK